MGGSGQATPKIRSRERQTSRIAITPTACLTTRGIVIRKNVSTIQNRPRISRPQTTTRISRLELGQHPVRQRLELAGLDGLGQDVIGLEGHHLGQLLERPARPDHDRHPELLGADGPEDLEAAAVGEPDVEQDQVERDIEPLPGLLDGAGDQALDAEEVEQVAGHPGQAGLILDDQHPGLAAVHARRARPGRGRTRSRSGS
jgi:hypothetical protein